MDFRCREMAFLVKYVDMTCYHSANDMCMLVLLALVSILCIFQITNGIYEITIPQIYVCSTKSSYWYPILYALEGILLLFGIFLGIYFMSIITINQSH